MITLDNNNSPCEDYSYDENQAAADFFGITIEEAQQAIDAWENKLAEQAQQQQEL